MIIVNESSFTKLSDDSKSLRNSFIYILSPQLTLQKDGDDEEEIRSNDKLSYLRPSQELLDKLASGEINKKKFKKAYIKQLKEPENEFYIYTIIRSLNEDRYMPIFVVNDEDWDIGFVKVLANYLEERFGIKQLKVKGYLSEVKQAWKTAKKTSSKGKKREKEFNAQIKGYLRDNVNLSFEGIKALEELDKKYAIHRMAVKINNSKPGDIKRKDIAKGIKLYQEYSKKSAKRVKRAIDALGISKKPDRWSKDDGVGLVAYLYEDIHKGSDE